MKKRSILLCIFSLLFVLTTLSTPLHAARIHSQLVDLYTVSDYPAIAKLLEKRIDEIESATAASSKAKGDELYKLHIMLAHTYAWRLGSFNDGLAEYERARELRLEQEKKKPGPNITTAALEYLFMAGMYEQIKDHARALEYYQKILQQVKAYSDAVANSGERIFLGSDLTYLIQYAIDTIQIQQQSAKTYTPLTKKIDLMHESNPMMLSLMLASVLPELEYMYENTNIEAFIKNNPPSMYSMLLEGCLMMSGLSAMEHDSTNQMPGAAQAFINKYPDSYLTLSTRFLLAQIAQQKGDTEQAQLHLTDLKKTAKKRNIELIIEADKKFAAPESTWEALRQAMRKGDVEAALLCHIPGDPQYKGMYSALGPDVLKKIAADMKPIEKIRADEQTAKYRATRFHKKADTEITYYIYFVNILGEWKIESM